MIINEKLNWLPQVLVVPRREPRTALLKNIYRQVPHTVLSFSQQCTFAIFVIVHEASGTLVRIVFGADVLPEAIFEQ